MLYLPTNSLLRDVIANHHSGYVVEAELSLQSLITIGFVHTLCMRGPLQNQIHAFLNIINLNLWHHHYFNNLVDPVGLGGATLSYYPYLLVWVQ